MKFNLKMIAVAAAMVATSSAYSAPVVQGTGDSSLVLYAFNSVTNAYYARDLGYTLNSFLPSSVTTGAGDGGVTGDKTPTTGLTLDKTTNASFADATFSTWLAGQTATDVRWSVYAGDNTTAGVNGVSRLLVASSIDPTVSNGTVRNGVNNAGGAQGLVTLGFTGFNTTGTTLPSLLQRNSINQPLTLNTLDTASSLFYFAATTQTGVTATTADTTKFGNSPTSFAAVTLASNGDFSYVLAPSAVSAVPIPAAAWLLGSGLMGMGGMMRRRKAAALA